MQRTTPSRHYGPHARFPGRPGASIWKLRHRQSLASTVPNATGAYRKLPGRVSHPLATHDFVAHNEATDVSPNTTDNGRLTADKDPDSTPPTPLLYSPVHS